MADKWKTVGTSAMTPTDNVRRKEVQVHALNIDAELMELHWASGIEVARSKIQVAGPHWQRGQNLEEEENAEIMHFKTGSQRPGVYLVSGKGAHELKVKLKIVKSGLMGEATLRGRLGGLKFSGDLNGSVGEHVVSLKIENPPKDCQHVEGDATWMLDAGSAGSKALKEKTRLELFFVLDKPSKIYKQGVWVEALRLNFKRAGLIGISDPAKVAASITKYCHSAHGMRYDTKNGASHFGASNLGGASFQLMQYIMKKGKDKNRVNCYDQAAAVQSLAAAVGVAMDWYFLQPYGYIQQTNLVGVGACNNPFFESNGSKPVVAATSKDRTAFGNHAFVGGRDKINDSCAGPHLGTESLRQYIRAAIDIGPSIEAVAPGYSPDGYVNALEGLPNPLRGLSGVV